MKLIVGLGNVQDKYKGTRHNVGEFAISKLIAKIKNEKLKMKNIGSKFFADIFIIENREKIILAKPLTFMNESGKVVKSIMKFYKISSQDLIVISDDIDMELGKVRERSSGSSGGHKGLQSIIDEIDSDKFTRIKIGIGRSEKIPPEKWVLQKFTENERKIIDEVIKKVTEDILTYFGPSEVGP